MAMYEVRGGVPLRGTVRASGAKNAATKQMVAALLSTEDSVFHNVPRIGDIEITAGILRSVGARVDWLGENSLVVRPAGVRTGDVSGAYSGLNRIPILLLGPLLHRCGTASVPVVGGDDIGPRPVDFHIKALQMLGAEIESRDGHYRATARRLKGNIIALPYPSVGATETALLSSCLAEGTTTIRNAATEPEIQDLILFLMNMGAIIDLDVDRTIVVRGVKQMRGAEHTVLTDRIEVGSFAAAAVATGGDVFVEGAQQDKMLSFLNYLRRAGGEFHAAPEGIRFFRGAQGLRSVPLQTDVHPGFATDWQQPFVVMLTQAGGVSIVHETVYESRFGYVSELKQMGASVELHADCLGAKPCRFQQRDYLHSCVIQGPTRLHGIDMDIPDLRAGFSYIIAALVAEGTSLIGGSRYVERGYACIPERLGALGARIRVLPERDDTQRLTLPDEWGPR
jgi:UDP-N-acetylglucosamine 1-carboxyvinyltransferase